MEEGLTRLYTSCCEFWDRGSHGLQLCTTGGSASPPQCELSQKERGRSWFATWLRLDVSVHAMVLISIPISIFQDVTNSCVRYGLLGEIGLVQLLWQGKNYYWTITEWSLQEIPGSSFPGTGTMDGCWEALLTITEMESSRDPWFQSPGHRDYGLVLGNTVISLPTLLMLSRKDSQLVPECL